MSILSKVYLDLIDAWQWNSDASDATGNTGRAATVSGFAVLYEESEYIVHFRDFFIRAHQIEQMNKQKRMNHLGRNYPNYKNYPKNWDMKLFQLQPDRPYRDILWQLKATKITHILVDVQTDHLLELLRQAQQVGLLTEHYSYLVTSLDLHTLELSNFRHSKANITSLRIVKEDHPLLQSLISDWQAYVARYMPRQHVPVPKHLKVYKYI